MDAVSRLVRLARLEGAIDVRCLLTGRFSLDNPAAEPGQVPFHLVVEGRCAIESGGRLVQVGPGDLVMFPHGSAHRVFAEGRERRVVEEPGTAFPTRRTAGSEPELDLFCGHYRYDTGAGSLLFRTLPPMLHVSFGVGPGEQARLLTTVMRTEAQTGGLGTAAIVSSLCDALLAMALRSRPEQRLGMPFLWTALGDDLGRAIEAVLSDPGQNWTIERLAADASMSRATFVRHFTNRTGTPVASLVTAIRMMIAADLLARDDRQIGAIATAVGYRSESAFGRAFRVAMGTTPARFRKLAHGKAPSVTGSIAG